MTSPGGRFLNFLSLYIEQKAHRLWGQPTVAWMISDPASDGGRYTVPSYLTSQY
jgi:hypothetical protein